MPGAGCRVPGTGYRVPRYLKRTLVLYGIARFCVRSNDQKRKMASATPTATTPLRESLAAIAIGEKYVAALLAAGFATAADVVNYRGDGLAVTPRCAETFARFMAKLHNATAAINVDDDEDLSKISSVVARCAYLWKASCVVATGPQTVPASVLAAVSSSELEKKRADDIFGATAYQAMNERFLVDLPPGHQVAGKLVRAMADDLDAGRLNPEAYKLPKLQLVSHAEREHRTELGAGVSIGTTEEVHALHRIGEVLMAIMRFMYLMLAAGGREINPHASTPWVGTKGDHGAFKKKAADGTVVSTRWHVTPASVHRYWSAATDASVNLRPDELMIAHDMMHVKIRELIGQGFNYESSLYKVLDAHTFGTLYAMATPADLKGAKAGPSGRSGGGGGGGASRAGASKPSRSERKKKNAGDRSDGRVRGKGVVAAICRDYNNPGPGCKYGADCRHLHECEICGSRTHGAVRCPEQSPEVKEKEAKRRK